MTYSLNFLSTLTFVVPATPPKKSMAKTVSYVQKQRRHLNVEHTNEDSIFIKNCVNFIVIKTKVNLRVHLLAFLFKNHQENSEENDEHLTVSLSIKEKNKLVLGTDRASKHASKASVSYLDFLNHLFSIPNVNNNAFRLKDQCLYMGV